jgi:hypothetical protein
MAPFHDRHGTVPFLRLMIFLRLLGQTNTIIVAYILVKRREKCIMLKIVGTDNNGNKIISKNIIDDRNHLTAFGWGLCVLDWVTDIALFALIYRLIRKRSCDKSYCE